MGSQSAETMYLLTDSARSMNRWFAQVALLQFADDDDEEGGAIWARIAVAATLMLWWSNRMFYLDHPPDVWIYFALDGMCVAAMASQTLM